MSIYESSLNIKLLCGLAEEAQVAVGDVEGSFFQSSAGLGMDVKRGGPNEVAVAQGDTQCGNPVELIP